MADRQFFAAADGGLRAARRGPLAQRQGQPAFASVDPTTPLGAHPPRDDENHRPAI